MMELIFLGGTMTQEGIFAETITDVLPKFIQQIPNLTLRPGTEAIIDVEVEAFPAAK